MAAALPARPPAGAEFHVIIPARFASSRLPAKPLLDIAGKPMVVRVAERAKASGAVSVHVATDHADILRACTEHGVAALMTAASHHSGTDRLAEAARLLALPAEAIVVNVQGDEPLIPPSLVREVALSLAAKPAAAIATACHPIEQESEFRSPHVVKVVADENGFALYFSRAPIPWPRDAFAESRGETGLPGGGPFLRHVGLYAYRVAFLHAYSGLAPVATERLEALEQLRALAHGYRIVLVHTESAPAAGVDTPEDLERVRAQFAPAAQTGTKA